MGVSSSASLLYPSLSTLQGASFEAMAQSALSWTERQLGRRLTAGEYTDRFSGMNNPILFLSSPPVLTVSEVVISSYIESKTYTPDSNYYTWTPDGQLHITPQGFWNQLPGWRPGIGNITAKYQTAGLNQAEIDMLVGSVMNWWTEQATKSVLANSETVMSYSYTMREGVNNVPQAVVALLNPYYRLTVG